MSRRQEDVETDYEHLREERRRYVRRRHGFVKRRVRSRQNTIYLPCCERHLVNMTSFDSPEYISYPLMFRPAHGVLDTVAAHASFRSTSVAKVDDSSPASGYSRHDVMAWRMRAVRTVAHTDFTSFTLRNSNPVLEMICACHRRAIRDVQFSRRHFAPFLKLDVR